MHELGHIPVEGETVELTGFRPRRAARRAAALAATVVRMDGRRIDLLELVQLGAGPTAGGRGR